MAADTASAAAPISAAPIPHIHHPRRCESFIVNPTLILVSICAECKTGRPQRLSTCAALAAMTGLEEPGLALVWSHDGTANNSSTANSCPCDRTRLRLAAPPSTAGRGGGRVRDCRKRSRRTDARRRSGPRVRPADGAREGAGGLAPPPPGVGAGR